MARISPAPTPSAPRVSNWRSEVRRDQLFAAALGVVLLAVSAFLRAALDERRTARDADGVQLVREDPESEKKLSSLAVTLPRLTLGGTRGLASMILWQTAEDDKNDRKWWDLETKYDLIGALQPYFSSVYIYHAWNMSYNISAQWQEQDIKYKWVLDGIEYLYRGEDFNPANPDIQFEEAQLYAMKLGLAAERIFYREHWKNDISRLHELNGKPDAMNDATVALQHVRAFIHRRDPRDPPAASPTAQGYFRMEELPDTMRPGGTAVGWGVRIFPDVDPATGFNLFKDRDDGKRATDPIDFRYGVSPFYFSYVEYRRLLRDFYASHVPPTNTSISVIDAWPAMSLRLWCRDDLYSIGSAMRKMFGAAPETALLKNPAYEDKIAEVHDWYRNIQIIAPRAVDLFDDDLSRFPGGVFVHTKHKLETLADKEIAKAEIKLFDALVAWQNNGRSFDGDNGAKVKAALMDADAAYKAAYPVTLKWVDSVYPIVEGQPPNPDRYDFSRYADELQARSKGIEALLLLQPGQAPDMSFLGKDEDSTDNDDVVEM